MTFSAMALGINNVVDYVVVSSDSSPYIQIYVWSDQLGFGTKFADPATTPTQAGRGVAFSRTKKDVAICFGSSVAAYPFVGGFGTKYANPANLPSSVAYVAFG